MTFLKDFMGLGKVQGMNQAGFAQTVTFILLYMQMPVIFVITEKYGSALIRHNGKIGNLV